MSVPSADRALHRLVTGAGAVLALIAVPAARPAHAQSNAGPSLLPAVSRVRMIVRSDTGRRKLNRVVGTVISEDDGTVLVRAERTGALVPVPVRNVTVADVSVGLHPHLWEGAVTGVVGGTLIGAVTGAFVGTFCDTIPITFCQP